MPLTTRYDIMKTGIRTCRTITTITTRKANSVVGFATQSYVIHIPVQYNCGDSSFVSVFRITVFKSRGTILGKSEESEK